MIKVMFVCHGNICRSPMAEFIFRDMLEKRNIKCLISSSATSSEEIGNKVHYGTKTILDRLGIDSNNKKAIKLTKDDCFYYDFIICMDEENVYNIKKITDRKIYKLLDFTLLKRDVADPWFTSNFEQTYKDIVLGLNGFYDYLVKEGKI